MLQPRSSLKIGQALWSTTYKVHESSSAYITIRRTGESYKNGSLIYVYIYNTFAFSTWRNRADPARVVATPPVAEAAVSSKALSDDANPSIGAAVVSANAATALSSVSAADPSRGADLHLVEVANASSTFYPEGPSIGAALASVDTAVLSPSVSVANRPTCTTFCRSMGNSYPISSWCCRLFKFQQILSWPNKCSYRSHKGKNCSPGSQCFPSCPVTNAPASSKIPNVGGYTAGTLGARMHDCVQLVFIGQ